jgi:putative membrane protein insertion efficiency factor
MKETRIKERVIGCIKSSSISIISVYQKIVSPLFPPSCIYSPTCSQYAIEAIGKYGVLKGSFMALKRVLRCTPFHSGGYDPVQ